MNQNTKKLFWYTILFSFCILPGLFLSYMSLDTPWTLFRISRANNFLSQGQVQDIGISVLGYRPEHMAGEFLYFGLLQATGWEPNSLVLLPTGSLLLAILSFALAKKISGSYFVSACSAIFASWFYPRLYTQFGTQTYAWTNILFLSFLLIYFHWLQKQNKISFILLTGVFLATFFHYHTTPIWMILIMVTTYLVKAATGKDSRLKHIKISFAAPLIFAVIYLQFDTVVYGDGLVRLVNEVTQSYFFESVYLRFFAPLFQFSPPTLNPFEVAYTNPKVATYSTLLILLLISLPVGIWILKCIQSAIKKMDLRYLAMDEKDLFTWAILVAAIGHTLMYGLYGQLDIRVVQSAFPFLLPLVFRQVKNNKTYINIIFVSLATAAVVGFISFSQSLTPYMTTSKLGSSTLLMRDGEKVLADANTYGTILAKGTDGGKVFDNVWLNPEIYRQIVFSDQIDSRVDYIAADTSGNPISTINWRKLEPWINYVEEISGHYDLERIYASEHLVLFQRSASDLPTSLDNGKIEEDLRQTYSAFGQGARLFLSALMFFVVPGLSIMLVIFRFQKALQLDFSSIIALVIGISVTLVTFIGYFLNLTGIGLNWFLLVIDCIAILAVVVVCFTRTGESLQNRGLYYAVATIVTCLLVWAFSSTTINQLRTIQDSEFVEYFITQDDDETNAIVVNIVNRKNEPIEARIVFQSGEDLLDLGSGLVGKKSMDAFKVSLPDSFLRQRTNILIFEDNIFRGSLSFIH